MRKVQTTRFPGATVLWRFAFLLAALVPFVVYAADVDLPDEFTGKVVGVSDGDTITLLVDKQTYKIRLEGIDAPELGQDFGTQSKKALSAAIFGKQVLVKTAGRDKYGRVLGHVFLNNFDINRGLVLHGWAWYYVKYSDSKKLAAAEKDAREAEVGLWSAKDAVPPWEWRAIKRTEDETDRERIAAKDKKTNDLTEAQRFHFFVELQKSLKKNASLADSAYGAASPKFDEYLEQLDNAALEKLQAKYGISRKQTNEILVEAVKKGWFKKLPAS